MADELESKIGDLVAHAECERTARARWSMALPSANVRAANYERYHRWYAPVEGDQWPNDRKRRPNKMHITSNMVKAFVDITARLLAIPPRFTNQPPTKDQRSSNKSEIVEELFMRFLELSSMETWLQDLTKVSTLYGISYLRPFWNEIDERPDVQVIEQPQNLLIGYGSSDFNVVDWGIYFYAISPLEAMSRWPQLSIENPGRERPLEVTLYTPDHDDPLSQKGLEPPTGLTSIAERVLRLGRTPTEYENKQVSVWDYWYRGNDGIIKNAILVQQKLVEGPTDHPELPIIPYIPVEHDHEPGSPEGMSLAEPLIPLQAGLNRVISHWSQLVADNSGTAYQIVGENADGVPEGIVPKEDEVVAPGPNNRIEPINRAVQNFPMERLIEHYLNLAYKVTGIPEIAFGGLPGAQTSGRAVAVQIESMANRLDPKRRRLYAALTTMLNVWGFMLIQKNIAVPVREMGEMGEEVVNDVKVGEFIKGFQRWKLIPPELTPRDSIEQAQNVIQLVQAKLLPLTEGMDQLGIESPEQMKALIKAERSDPHLFPQDVQAYTVLVQLLQSIQMANAQQAALSAEASGAAAAGVTAAEQAGGPRGFEDQNQPGLPTGPGGAPPAGAPAPGGGIGAELQPLLRQTSGGQSQAMSQIVLPSRNF